MEDRGSITIASLILLSLILFIAVSILSLVDLQNLNNKNSQLALQNKFNLYSYYNILKNDQFYIDKITSFVEYNFFKGLKTSEETFKMEDKNLANTVNEVNLFLNQKDELQINMYTGLDGTNRILNAKYRLINPIFASETGVVNMEEDRELKVEIEDFFRAIDDKINSDMIIFNEGDLIVDKNFKFKGIILVKDGRIIVEDGNKLEVEGYIVTKDPSVGDIEIDCNLDIVKKAGIALPNFIVYDLVYLKIKEGSF